MKNPFYDKSLAKRHKKSKIIKYFSLFSLIFSLGFLIFFLTDIISKGLPAFKIAYVKIQISYNEKSMQDSRFAVEKKYRRIISRAYLRQIPKQIKQNPKLLNTQKTSWVLANHQVDQYLKNHRYKLKPKDKQIVDELKKQGLIKFKFNSIFFTHGDSKIPEYAGISSAIFGSVLTLIVTMAFAFPLGVMTAIYLEEFAKENKLTYFIEVNLNNLAAIPSMLFGLLGLSVFINLFSLPRSSPLVGGLTLALMSLPIIIVSSRASIRAIPNSIRQAAYGLGLTKIQVAKDHILPLAFPGILTGSIIGLAQAMGETAPLIIIGMIAFVPSSPTSLLDAATIMPAQIFTWAGMPEGMYVEKTAAGILVLLSILLCLNLLAIILRKKLQIKW
ncbi:MAG: phosphate ABC transporter, permease protein PstA [Proteobacteria bacterium]|nr:MAG: phosphate ABC transporter, permease protein PstA [Pseudomonadota bacterium]